MSEWISVEDRLPDAPGHYLVCTSINYWHGGCLDENEERKDGLKCGTPEGYEGTTMSVLDCYFDGTGCGKIMSPTGCRYQTRRRTKMEVPNERNPFQSQAAG